MTQSQQSSRVVELANSHTARELAERLIVAETAAKQSNTERMMFYRTLSEIASGLWTAEGARIAAQKVLKLR